MRKRYGIGLLIVGTLTTWMLTWLDSWSKRNSRKDVHYE